MRSIDVTVPVDMARAEAMVRDALGEQGFGVLTEIDVAATLRARLGVERAGLKILGACNPGFAHRALQIDPSAALVLPCNVVLEEVGDGSTRVAIADPRALMPDEAFADLAADAAAGLEAAARTIRARHAAPPQD